MSKNEKNKRAYSSNLNKIENEPLEEFYTPEELAKLLKVDYSVIVEEILAERNAGKYPIIQLKSNFEYRIPKSTVIKFIFDSTI